MGWSRAETPPGRAHSAHPHRPSPHGLHHAADPQQPGERVWGHAEAAPFWQEEKSRDQTGLAF